MWNVQTHVVESLHEADLGRRQWPLLLNHGGITENIESSCSDKPYSFTFEFNTDNA